MLEATLPNAAKAFALFFSCGLFAYAINILLRHLEWWGWVQFFAPTVALLLPSLGLGIFLSHKLNWFSVEASAGRYLTAAFFVAVSFPLAFVTAIVLGILFDQVLPSDSQESFPLLKSLLNQTSVYLAALVIPVLAYFTLRIITGRWDTPVLILMISAVLVSLLMVPFVQLFGERADDVAGAMFFPFFPLGFSLLCGVYGYGLARGNKGG